MTWILGFGACVISGMLVFVISAVLFAVARADEATERAMRDAKRSLDSKDAED